MPPNFKNYTDRRFGRLVATELSNPSRRNGNTFWKCRCDCGTIADFPIRHLINGAIRSCGCLQREHYQNRNPIIGRSHLSKLSDTQVREIRSLLAQNKSVREIASLYGVVPNTIANIKRNQTHQPSKNNI